MQECKIEIWHDFEPLDFLQELLTRIQKIAKNGQIDENRFINICLDLMKEYNYDKYSNG